MLGLYISFVALIHHFLCVAVFHHQLEELEDEIMSRVGKKFDYLVRQGIGAVGLSCRLPLACHGVVAACEIII